MANPDFLRGPWQAVLSQRGDILTSPTEGEDEEFDICIARGSAIPVEQQGILDWPSVYSGDDEIDLWDDVEPEDIERRWAQAQAMAAGLNAAGHVTA